MHPLDILAKEKISKLFFGLHFIEDPKDLLKREDLDFSFSGRDIFGLKMYDFVADLSFHPSFPEGFRNGQVSIEFGTPVDNTLIQKILISIALSKEFDLHATYENLVVEIKKFGENTKVETSLNGIDEVIAESIIHTTSPDKSVAQLSFYFTKEDPKENFFIAELSRRLNKGMVETLLEAFD